MNVLAITGRLTKDPEIRRTQSGDFTFADFSIATQRDYKAKDATEYETDFFYVTTGGVNATFAEKYLTKGIKVEISGCIKQDRWTDKDGNNRSRVVIVANRIRFAESKAASKKSEEGSDASAKQTTDTGFVNIPDGIDEESLPFM